MAPSNHAKPPTPRSPSGDSMRATDLFGPGSEAFLSAEAPISEDVAHLLAIPGVRSKSTSPTRLRDVIGHSVHHSSEESGSPGGDVSASNASAPHKRGPRPSPWWMLFISAFGSIVTSMTMAPKTEVYIRLVCAQYKPEFMSPAPIEMPLNHTIPPLPPNSPTFTHHNSDNAIVVNILDIPATPSPTAPDDGGDVHVTVPRPNSKCTSDPEVGRIVAGLTTAITLTMGILSVLTTGFWASYSDRVGRKRVLGIVVFGGLCSDVIFIVTTLRASRIPGGYNLFILGSAVFGLSGGITTSMAASQSYVADCADPTSRARMFSLFYGLWFAGMAIGPTIGGLLITKTNDMLSVFYLATAGHIIVALLVWLILPETLTPEVLAANRSAREAAKLNASSEDMLAGGNQLFAYLQRLFAGLFFFLTPLNILLPRKKLAGEPGAAQGKRDWNLTFIAIGCAFLNSIVGMIPLKFQYAEAQFDWSSETLGYFLTGMGVFRAFHLSLLLPLIIRIFGPQKDRLRDSRPDDATDPSQPLLSELRAETSQNRPRAARNHSLTPSHAERVDLRHGHSSADFDLVIARASLIVDLMAYILITSSQNGLQFFAASMISSFGGGFNPATQSLALYLMPDSSKDAGKLFGALGMVGALSTQVFGPAAFGALYMATVAVFPKTIFILGAFIIVCALTALSCVRLPRRSF